MKKIAVCDDHMMACNVVQQYCMQWIEQNQKEAANTCCVDMYSNAIDYCASRLDYDVLFLDIAMPEINGIKLKSLLERKRSDTLIIYITNHPELMQKAFGKNVIAFLKKPVKKEEIFNVLDKIKELEIPDTEVMIEGCPIKVGQLLYIESKRSYMEIYINKHKSIISWKPLSQWCSRLQEYDFVKTHRSYLVNMNCVEDIYETRVKLRDGTQLPISRNMKKQVKEAYQKICRRKEKIYQ